MEGYFGIYYMDFGRCSVGVGQIFFETELRSAYPLKMNASLSWYFGRRRQSGPTSQNFILYLLILLWFTSENSADGFSGSADDRRESPVDSWQRPPHLGFLMGAPKSP